MDCIGNILRLRDRIYSSVQSAIASFLNSDRLDLRPYWTSRIFAMTSPTLSQIEQFISLLSYEEQLWLIEQIIHNLRVTRSNDNLSNQPQTFEQQLSIMANDPAIQEELKAIDWEFAITEMDGLT